MSAEVSSAGESLKRLLFRGIRGESIGSQLECSKEIPSEIMEERDFVARPIPIIEAENKLMNMRAYIGGVVQATNSDGNVIEDVIIYANLLNNMACNEDWLCISERNKDGIFHVHILARTGVRTDSWRRTAISVWDTIKKHQTVIQKYGNVTLDMLKCQKAHKPTALGEYMCKAPIWICSNTERYLQWTYDICIWDMNSRFKSQPEEKQTDIDQANPMVKEILQCIMEHNCKTVEEVIKTSPELVVKHLHKPAFGSIIQNCLTFSKCVKHTWSLKQYAGVVSDPSHIHGPLLHQGINPSDFDYVFWQWITKRHTKRNTLHIYGPSNTGKSSLFIGLGKCCPVGEIVNGVNFNFEGLVDAYWGKWEEPYCAPEIAEKFKQIAEGMETAIAIKFKRPYTLPRTPIAIMTNSMIWEWCQNQKGPFRNRMWFYTFAYDMSTGVFIPRTTERNCQCRYCEISRGGPATAGRATTSGLSGKKQSIQRKLASGISSTEPSMGNRSMSERTGSSGQPSATGSSGGEPSSYATAGGSTSSTTSGGNGSSGEHGSSNTSKRIHDTRTRSSEHMESDSTSGCDRYDSRHVAGTTGESTRTDVTRQHTRSNENVSTVVPVGGAREKKRKVEIHIQTDQQSVGGKLATVMAIPGKNEWASYLSYIYNRYEKSVSKPDLFAYEEYNSDSE
ncbi:nonstructural protein 1 [Galliform chaphamaparvovirus 8]|nr:nonstructural protein 1 [Galliform chaphamaparvovirus 8]